MPSLRSFSFNPVSARTRRPMRMDARQTFPVRDISITCYGKTFCCFDFLKWHLNFNEKQVLLRVIWEECVAPHWLQWDVPNSPTKQPFPFDDHHPSNTPIHRPTPLTIIPNGIWIQSAVLPKYTFWTDRPTHTHTDRQMG